MPLSLYLSIFAYGYPLQSSRLSLLNLWSDYYLYIEFVLVFSINASNLCRVAVYMIFVITLVCATLTIRHIALLDSPFEMTYGPCQDQSISRPACRLWAGSHYVSFRDPQGAFLKSANEPTPRPRRRKPHHYIQHHHPLHFTTRSQQS